MNARRSAVWIAVVTIGLAVISAFFWATWSNSPPAVTVTPEGDFILSTGVSSNTTELTVRNHTGRTLYGVQVEIKCNEPGVPPEHMVLVIESATLASSPPDSPKRTITSDAQDMTLGTTDAQQRRSWLVILHSVEPERPRRISVSGGLQIKSSARAQVVGYRESPSGELIR